MVHKKGLIGSFKWYMYVPIIARPNRFRCRDIELFFNGNIALQHQLTHLKWLYLRIKNQIDLKRYEVYSEQIVQFHFLYNGFDI